MDSMKNLFNLPTEEPSHFGLFTDTKGSSFKQFQTADRRIFPNWEPHFIYIVSDGPIKKDDWCMSLSDDETFETIYKCKKVSLSDDEDKRIILTNDPLLIYDGVQQLNPDFIKEYVKNPVSWVHVETQNYMPQNNGKAIDFPIAFEINITDPTKNTLAYYVATVPVKINSEINIIDEWLNKHGDPEIAKQVEEEEAEFLSKNLFTEEEMLNFGKYCHREALSPNNTMSFEDSLEQFKKTIR